MHVDEITKDWDKLFLEDYKVREKVHTGILFNSFIGNIIDRICSQIAIALKNTYSTIQHYVGKNRTSMNTHVVIYLTKSSSLQISFGSVNLIA